MCLTDPSRTGAVGFGTVPRAPKVESTDPSGGIGADADFTPKLRASLQANQLFFVDTAVLEAARNQDGIHKRIGVDVSLSVTYRPYISQNVVLRVAGSLLVPQQGYKDLFGSDDIPYSIFANLILAY